MLDRIMLLIFAVLLGFGLIQMRRANSFKESNDLLSTSNKTLLDSVDKYRTSDSLSAAAVGVLNLTLDQFKKYRSSDAALIATLKTEKRNLQSVTNAQTRTINRFNGILKDSIRVRPVFPEDPEDPEDKITYVYDTLKCVDISEPWFSLNGCIEYGNSFVGSHVSRDSLLIAATVEYKRFLGFLWRTNKIKNRKIDIVSRNPDTEILGVEYVEIIK